MRSPHVTEMKGAQVVKNYFRAFSRKLLRILEGRDVKRKEKFLFDDTSGSGAN